MNLNKYQKIQILLLLTIIIAATIFIISLIRTIQLKNYAIEETAAELTTTVNQVEEEAKNNIVPIEQNVTENEENTEDTSWDEEDVENTQVNKDEESKEEQNKSKYYIKVNYTANVVTIYTKGSSGKYTEPVKAMVCSTGTATPRSGVYKMSNKYRWHQLNGGVYGQYCSRITGHILFHSVPYRTNSPDTLKYTSYDKLGTAASAGCIRLTVADALWIYSNCPSGTYVEFYSSTNPGPLGKPTAKKISSNTTCRNWDPTDPLSNNPWHTYTEQETTNSNQSTEQTNNTSQKNDNDNVQSNNNESNKNQNSNNENNNNMTEDKNDNNQSNNEQSSNNEKEDIGKDNNENSTGNNSSESNNTQENTEDNKNSTNNNIEEQKDVNQSRNTQSTTQKTV